MQFQPHTASVAGTVSSYQRSPFDFHQTSNAAGPCSGNIVPGWNGELTPRGCTKVAYKRQWILIVTGNDVNK
jgi:hypothetical protein